MKQHFSRLTVPFPVWMVAVGMGGTLIVRSLVADVAPQRDNVKSQRAEQTTSSGTEKAYTENRLRRDDVRRVVNADWSDDESRTTPVVPTDGSIIHASGTGPGAAVSADNSKTSGRAAKPGGAHAISGPESATATPPLGKDAALNQKVSPQATAAEVLKLARDRLLSYRSLRAKLSERGHIGENRFSATGNYLQGTQLKLRLDLNFRKHSTDEVAEANLLQVCDGQVLWTLHNYGKRPRITRRDVRQILTAAASERSIPRNVLIAELGIGGLPGLLAALEMSLVLEPRRDEQIDGKSLIVLQGTWNETLRDQFQKANVFGKGLPIYVPESVRIYFDEHLLPRRILYLKTPKGADEPQPMLTLDFSSIQVNGELNDKEFDYSPPDGIFPEDISRQFLDPILDNIKKNAKPPQ